MALSKNTQKLLKQYSELDKLNTDDIAVKMMMQQSEEFAASRLNQLGLNRKKNDLNQDLADYERGLRAKLERRT